MYTISIITLKPTRYFIYPPLHYRIIKTFFVSIGNTFNVSVYKGLPDFKLPNCSGVASAFISVLSI